MYLTPEVGKYCQYKVQYQVGILIHSKALMEILHSTHKIEYLVVL